MVAAWPDAKPCAGRRYHFPMNPVSTSVAAVLRQARDRIDPADAALLLAHALGHPRAWLLAHGGDAVAAEDAGRFEALVERRATGVPVAYLTGSRGFWTLDLAVTPATLVPRPETELLVELALARIPSDVESGVADLGTGSGAIALALATEVPHAQVVAVERSPEAHVWAERNVRASGADNIRLVLGDLADALPELDGTVDVVASNPPYIPDEAIPRDVEVRLHDPAAALYGGPDGLDVVRTLSRRARALLRPGGALVIEHGELQGSAMRDLLASDGWRAAATHRDLLGRDRVTTAVR